MIALLHAQGVKCKSV